MIDTSKSANPENENDDRFWTAAKLMKQMQERVIPAFESRYPGKQALFLFDHSALAITLSLLMLCLLLN